MCMFFMVLSLNPDSGVTEHLALLYLLSEPFLSRAETTMGASFPVGYSAPDQSYSVIGDVESEELESW